MITDIGEKIIGVFKYGAIVATTMPSPNRWDLLIREFVFTDFSVFTMTVYAPPEFSSTYDTLKIPEEQRWGKLVQVKPTIDRSQTAVTNDMLKDKHHGNFSLEYNKIKKIEVQEVNAITQFHPSLPIQATVVKFDAGFLSSFHFYVPKNSFSALKGLIGETSIGKLLPS